MKDKHRRVCVLSILTLLLCIALAGGNDGAGEAVTSEPLDSNSQAITQKEPKVIKPVSAAIIICKGMIDDGLYKSILRRSEIALEQGADYIFFEISTYGGLVKSADDISKYFILELGKKVHTVAYVTTEAISAGAMISVSCKDIIMRENTTIGDCAPIALGAKLEDVEREKAESFIRAAFARAAEANNYPEALLKAMVSQKIEVYRVKNLETEEYEFFESDDLPKDPNKYDIKDKERVVKDDEILTLTATKAFEYGIARAKVEDIDGAFTFLEERDGVVFTTEAVTLETNWSEEMVRMLNSPAATGLLFMIALLGVYMELSTPGVGLPGLVAVICFTILFGSKYLVGMANWVEVLVFFVGVLLLAIEIFVIPGFGIAGVTGMICIILGLFGILVGNRPDELPWPKTDFDWELFSSGAIGLSLGFFGFLFLAMLLAKYLPKFELFSSLVLAPSTPRGKREVQISITAPPETESMRVNVGDAGEVVLPLRPVGSARFGDAIVDVVTEGAFLKKGTKVKIVEIHGNRVVVRAIED